MQLCGPPFHGTDRIKLFTGLNGFGNYAGISVTQEAFYAIQYSDRTLKHSIEQSKFWISVAREVDAVGVDHACVHCFIVDYYIRVYVCLNDFSTINYTTEMLT